jgi:predicted nucleotidyltransferase
MSQQEIVKKIKPILRKQGVKKAALFGSVARGDNKKNSDVDILIEPPKKFSLLDLSGLKIDLEEILNKKVDILTYDGIHPLLKDIILNEQVLFYEKRP